MRKSAIIIKGLILFILFSQTHTVFSQEFGKIPFRQCWQKDLENISESTIASDNDSPFILSISEGLIDSSDINTSKTIWQSEIGGEISSGITTDAEKIFVTSKIASSDDFQIAKVNIEKTVENRSRRTNIVTINSLSKKTGITNWQSSFTALPDESIFTYSIGEQLLILTGTGHILYLNKSNGQASSDTTLRFAPISIPLLFENSLFFGSTNNLITLSASTGLVEKTWELKITPSIIFTTDSKTLIAGDKTGNILSVNNEDGKINWQIQTGAEISSITKAGKGFLVSSLDNYVYLFAEKSGRRIWRKRLSGRTVGKPVIKDDIAVFSTLNGKDTVFLDIKNGKTINQILLNDENYFISNPLDGGNLIIFHTLKGLLAYGTKNQCTDKL